MTGCVIGPTRRNAGQSEQVPQAQVLVYTIFHQLLICRNSLASSALSSENDFVYNRIVAETADGPAGSLSIKERLECYMQGIARTD